MLFVLLSSFAVDRALDAAVLLGTEAPNSLYAKEQAPHDN